MRTKRMLLVCCRAMVIIKDRILIASAFGTRGLPNAVESGLMQLELYNFTSGAEAFVGCSEREDKVHGGEGFLTATPFLQLLLMFWGRIWVHWE